MPVSSALKTSVKDVPFFGNLDGRKCGPCVYRMVLKYFEPEKDYSFEDINRLCAAAPKKNTWLFSITTNLADMGYDVRVITNYDFPRMVYDFEGYLTDRNGEEIAKKSLEASDMDHLPEQLETFMGYVKSQKIAFEERHWTKENLIDALDAGYLACIWVNYYTLRKAKGHAGHFILCFDYDDDHFIIHDPGHTDEESYMVNKAIPYNLLIEAASQGGFGKTDDLILIKPLKPSENELMS